MRPVILASESMEDPEGWPEWSSSEAIYADGQWWEGPDTYTPGSPPYLALSTSSPESFANVIAPPEPATTHRPNRFILRFPQVLETAMEIVADFDLYQALEGIEDQTEFPLVQFWRPSGTFFTTYTTEHLGGTLYRVRTLVDFPNFEQTDVWLAPYPSVGAHVYSVSIGEDEPVAGGLWPLRQRQSLIGPGSWPVRQRQIAGHSGSWPIRQRQQGI